MPGVSACSAPMRSCGRCFLRHPQSVYGTRFGRRPCTRGNTKEVQMGRLLNATSLMKPGLLVLAVCLYAFAAPADARAFCGFYVGSADTQLYNHASQVAMARDGNRTVISLMNDYQGEPSDFALVIPVPVVLQRGPIHVRHRD